MKTTIKAARILTWINLISWGGLLGLLLLFSLASFMLPVIIVVFLLSAIPLNNYAALQLQKSIRHPQVKLSSQTPTGVRFIGFVALFFGISTVVNAIALIADPSTALKSMETSVVESKGVSERELVAVMRFFSGFIALMGA